MPVALISTITSPAFGPSSWTVSTERGFPDAWATAARTSMVTSVLKGEQATPSPASRKPAPLHSRASARSDVRGGLVHGQPAHCRSRRRGVLDGVEPGSRRLHLGARAAESPPGVFRCDGERGQRELHCTLLPPIHDGGVRADPPRAFPAGRRQPDR